jgi:thiamine-monophosphate kinase
MTRGEFSVIKQFFSRPVPEGIQGYGDDAARLPLPPDTDLVSCKDLLIEGRHFFANVDPYMLGHKALAVNLSDLAAMGATPLACLLGIGLPKTDDTWLEAFAQGFYQLADQWNCPLIGGDTVGSEQGIVLSVTALGTLPQGQSGLRRDLAKVDDDIWVSGHLGGAGIALRGLSGTLDLAPDILAAVRPCLEQPAPRVSLGRALLPLAHAAIDISDGLVQDLQHVLEASQCGAILDQVSLPIHSALSGLDPGVVQSAVLYGGDVYELCFTAPVSARQNIAALSESENISISRIGTVCAKTGLSLLQQDGQLTAIKRGGFDHFK